MASLRILIADRQEQVRNVLTAVLTSRGGWEICGQAKDGQEAIHQAARLRPNLVLLDLDLVSPNGLETTRLIVQNDPAQNVILLTYSDADDLARRIYDAGARGFVLKSRATRDLVPAIDALQDGRTFFTPRIAEAILNSYLQAGSLDDANLSKHQRHTLHGLAREMATSINSFEPRQSPFRRARKYVVIAVLALITGVLGWYSYLRRPDQEVPYVDDWFVRAGLKSGSGPITFGGNPDSKVWIDLHTGLYYCAGNPAFGKTRNGRFALQRDAQADHFEPALRKGCD